MRSDFQGTQSSKSSGARTRTAVLLWKTNTRSSLSGQRRALKPRSRIFRALEGPTVKSQVGNKGLALVFLSPETQGPPSQSMPCECAPEDQGCGPPGWVAPPQLPRGTQNKGGTRFQAEGPGLVLGSALPRRFPRPAGPGPALPRCGQ